MKRLIITTASLLLLHANAAYGQQMWHKPKKYLTIGFTTGVSAPKISLKPIPCSNCYTNGLYLRRYINRHLSIESGIRFSTDHFTTPVVRVAPGYYKSRTQPMATDIPVAIKYYLGPASKKLNTAIGIGCYYSFGNTINQQQIDHTVTTTSHKSFVPFSIMHGVSYKLTDKIEINETIHFTPKDENGCKQFGLDLGVGVHL